MSNEKMREEFEAWVKNHWTNQSLDRFNHLHGESEGKYQGFTVQHCWDAWKASRAAIEVGLPIEDATRCHTVAEEAKQEAYNQALGECQYAIESLGLKVKS